MYHPLASPSPIVGKPTCDQRGTFSEKTAAALELVASSGVTFRLPVKGTGHDHYRLLSLSVLALTGYLVVVLAGHLWDCHSQETGHGFQRHLRLLSGVKHGFCG